MNNDAEDAAARGRLLAARLPFAPEAVRAEQVPAGLEPLLPLLERYGRSSEDEHQELWEGLSPRQAADLLLVSRRWHLPLQDWLCRPAADADPVPPLYVRLSHLHAIMMDG